MQVSSGFSLLDLCDISNFSDSQDEEEDYVSIHSVFARKAQRPIMHSTVEDFFYHQCKANNFLAYFMSKGINAFLVTSVSPYFPSFIIWPLVSNSPRDTNFYLGSIHCKHYSTVQILHYIYHLRDPYFNNQRRSTQFH